MKVLVDKTPKKKEECLFYRKYQDGNPFIIGDWCSINGMKCSFKNEDSIFGGECRCLKDRRGEK